MIAASACLPVQGFAAEMVLPETPQLVIERGMHTAVINSADTDAKGRWLVTASSDKTARVWDVATGTLLQVLRPPIGPKMGDLLTVAMSPDGKWVATTGWSADNTGAQMLYLFDRAAGTLARQIQVGQWPFQPMKLLAWSPNGDWLAAAHSGTGVRIWETRTWQETYRDEGKRLGYRALDFHRNKLIVASQNVDSNEIAYSLYAAKGKTWERQHQRSVPSEYKPTSLRFSPNGRQIAVGYDDLSGKVEVLDGETLEIAFTPKTSYFFGDLRLVAWATNGNTLYAAGGSMRNHRVSESPNRLEHDVRRQIQAWPNSGRGSPQQLVLPPEEGILTNLLTLPKGEILYTSSNPAWRKLDAAGVSNLHIGFTPRADEHRLLVSQDGKQVAFTLLNDGTTVTEGWGKDMKQTSRDNVTTAAFDLNQLAMKPPTEVVRTHSHGISTEWTRPDLTGLSPARTEAPGLKIDNWRFGQKTTLNGKPFLGEGLHSFSLAIDPQGTGFVVGGMELVSAHDRTGKALWSKLAPGGGAVWSVNISQDGRLVVASCNDGSLHWYRYSDGKELLTLYPMPDGRQWVALTPDGYYAAAPGAEGILGWHINRFAESHGVRIQFVEPNGPAARGGMQVGDVVQAINGRPIKTNSDLRAAILAGGTKPQQFDVLRAGQPLTLRITPVQDEGRPRIKINDREIRPSLTSEFYPVSRFRERFYRPDVIQKVLTTLDVNEAVKQANLESGRTEQTVALQDALPPIVSIDAPEGEIEVKQDKVTLRFAVKAPQDAPATTFFARVNGKPVEASQARSLAQPGPDGAMLREITLSIPPQDGEVMLFARNRNGISEASKVRVRGAQKASQTTADSRPRLFVLAVGVSDYSDKTVDKLGYAAKDAQDFAGRMAGQEHKLYRSVQIKRLTDRDVNRASLLTGLKWLTEQVTANDVGILFMAGHGASNGRGHYFYLPADAHWKNLDQRGLSFNDIRDALASMKGRAIFMLDTCHSGDVLGRKGLDTTHIANEFHSPEYGVVVMAASTGAQESLESDAWGNGAFTKAVLEGVAGQADYEKDGTITYKMLDLYVSRRVKDLAKQVGRVQTPFTVIPNGTTDFPIAVSR